MKIGIIAPVFNEAPWIGYSIMDVLPYVHDITYTCAKSTDGTDELLDYISAKYAGNKLRILRKPEYNFDPHDMKAYNQAFNDAISASESDAVWFKHPDMVCLNPEKIKDMQAGPLAWYTNITSFAGGFDTKITKGRANKWKNIHLKKFGLHYYGEYGSVNEDFYHKAITGKEYKFHGLEFDKYPFEVKDSGLIVNHYCELKGYKRRYEKMKNCLKTLLPNSTDEHISELAAVHPRVTLSQTSDMFSSFEFTKGQAEVPPIIVKYQKEFEDVISGRKA